MRSHSLPILLLAAFYALCATALPVEARPLRFDLTILPGQPTELRAGETTVLEVFAYDNRGTPLVGETFVVDIVGATLEPSGSPITDYQGKFLIPIQALCVDNPVDIVVSVQPQGLGGGLAQSITIPALGGNDPILYVVNPEAIAAVGSPVTIYCQLHDPCGDPVSDTITVEHVYGVSSVEWTGPGEFRVIIDTSGTPSTGYEETVVIRAASGDFAEVMVRVLSELYSVSWMYLSTVPDHYDCGIDDPRWDSGDKDIHVVVELDSQVWTAGDGYTGAEFSVDYPPGLLFSNIELPQAPSAIYIGGCDAGHCSLLIGSASKLELNPWNTARLTFTNFGAGDNLLFTLGPADNGVGPAPAWAFYAPVSPIVYHPEAPAQGIDPDHKPTWQAGVVLLNYNPQTIPPEMVDELSARIQHPGHPLWMQQVGVEAESWGAVKAGFRQ